MQKRKAKLRIIWLRVVLIVPPFSASLIATHLLKLLDIGAALSLLSFFVLVLFHAVDLYREHDPLPFFAGFFSYLALNLNIISQFAVIYGKVGLFDSAGSIVKDRWTTGYFSILTWAGANYGDLRPTAAARPWVVGETLAGYVALGLLLVLVILALERGSKKIPAKEQQKAQRVAHTTSRISDIL
jgi:hypothetical protein